MRLESEHKQRELEAHQHGGHTRRNVAFTSAGPSATMAREGSAPATTALATDVEMGTIGAPILADKDESRTKLRV